MPPTLAVDFCGLRLKNPIVVAPAGITETYDRVRRLEDQGVAAVVMKSYAEAEYMRRSPTPRFSIIRHRFAGMRGDVLYSFEQAAVADLDGYCCEIERCKQGCDIPIIASIHCHTDEGWAEAARACEEAGADAIELNASCPHGVQVMGGIDVAGAIIDALQAARSQCNLPLIAKLTPQLDNPVRTALQVEEAGADALVMFNRFTGIDFDLDALRPIMHGSFAGHGGPWAIHYVLRWIALASPRVRVPIAASGGVWGGQGALKMILAGATLVQVCSAVVVEGVQAAGRILRELEAELERRGFESVEQARGLMCDRILPTDKVDRRRVARAQIDPEKCTACGTCQRVCIYGAVQAGEEAYQILPDKCDGCGLCAEVCPAGAIAMVPV